MAPPVIAYVGGVVIILGACYVVKEYVYEPYVAPALERWAMHFLAARNRNRALHRPMAQYFDGDDDEELVSGKGKAKAMTSFKEDRRSDSRLSRGSEWDARTFETADSASTTRLTRPGVDMRSRFDLPPHEGELAKMADSASSEKGSPWSGERDYQARLRKRPISRPSSRPTSFVEMTEGPGLPASAYVPLSPAPTNEPGSPLVRLSHPLSSPPPPAQLLVSAPAPLAVLSPPASTAGLAIPATSQSPTAQRQEAANPIHLILRSPQVQQAATSPLMSSYSLSGQSPYPSRPPSAMSSVLSPPVSNASLPSMARTRSWTNVSHMSGMLSDADVLSQSDRDMFGTDDEAGSELASESELGSAWDDVSRLSGHSVRSM